MKTQIETKENNIICTVTSLEYSNRKCEGRIYMDTKGVKQLLVDEGHNPGAIVIESRVDNCDNKLEGTWVFEDANKTKAPELKIRSKIQTQELRKQKQQVEEKIQENPKKFLTIHKKML
jgi:hypothetical protein